MNKLVTSKVANLWLMDLLKFEPFDRLLKQKQTLKLHQILLDLELHISLFSARIRKQTRLCYLVVSMIQEWTLQLPV